MDRRTEPNGATLNLRRSRRVLAQLGRASRQTDFHSQIPRVLSYLVLMVVSLLCRSPSDWAKGLSCEMSPTARNRVVGSSTWAKGRTVERKWAFASCFQSAAPQFWGLPHTPPDWK